MLEIQTPGELDAWLALGAPLQGVRLQGLDLTAYEGELSRRTDLAGAVVLGGTVPTTLEHHLREQGAILFPSDPRAPIDPYRAHLYQPGELYAGLEEGYAATPDSAAYTWSIDGRIQHDAFVTSLRALHDDAMSDALEELLLGRRVVGVMGGHALLRGSEGYAAAARLGHSLAARGLLVLTGGGPGAMEAANLGAFAPGEAALADALQAVAAVPGFARDITAWARLGLAVRERLVVGSAGVRAPRSVGIPTWFYGHEPPNVFCDAIAKYFSNALREEGLLARSVTGVVVLPGAAGTVQEVFQATTPLYYAAATGPLPRLVLVGVEHWTTHLPVWPLLQALARERRMAEVVHLVDAVDDAAEILS